jgi:hypothetical protein
MSNGRMGRSARGRRKRSSAAIPFAVRMTPSPPVTRDEDTGQRFLDLREGMSTDREGSLRPVVAPPRVGSLSRAIRNDA